MNQQRFYLEDAIYFVTTRTDNNRPVFAAEQACKILTNAIFTIIRETKTNLFGFVIIPDHTHLLIQPTQESISKVMNLIKGRSARLINKCLLAGEPLGSHHCSHSNITTERKRSAPRHKYTRHLWQKSFHDHVIRDQEDFNRHIEYLKYNPVKHGLIKEGEGYPFLFIDESLIKRFLG